VSMTALPASIASMVQTGLLERAFHDALYPVTLFRAEAVKEEWPANTGTEMFMTRPGLLTPVTDALVTGTDPAPQAMNWEQWPVRLDRYAGTLDTHMPTSVTGAADIFMRNIQQLGLQAGQSMNRIARNALFQAYLSGQTNLVDAGIAADTQIHVASLNGFVDVITLGTNVRPTPVSVAAPLTISIGVGAALITRSVILATPDDVTDPLGPGVLFISVALGAGFAARTPVVSVAAPTVFRVGGGASVDSLAGVDTFNLQACVNSSNWLRRNNVQPHEDGFYHAHISPMANAQIFEDTAFQRMNTSLPDGAMYKEGFIGQISGIMFYLNPEAPDSVNSGTRTATGTSAFYSKGIAAETTNNGGFEVGRVIVTGRNCMFERYLNESQYVSEAGVTGKVGEFDIVSNGVAVSTENVRLTLRAPIDRLQDIVASTWSISTGFALPSDATSGGNARFKRAVAIEFAA
jgi:hypothetical protein